MSARTFLTQGIAAAVLTIGVIHSAGLAGVTASVGETQRTVINADDKWDIPIPHGVTPTPGTGDGNS
ncbi:hypothetical protein ACFY0N_33015 [Streptomyces vinaceus]|uniref:hypothetical protein n=1 Tax=Streptomyces vinaceus TaxID=1960 RepID=UPI003679B7DC